MREALSRHQGVGKRPFNTPPKPKKGKEKRGDPEGGINPLSLVEKNDLQRLQERGLRGSASTDNLNLHEGNSTT